MTRHLHSTARRRSGSAGRLIRASAAVAVLSLLVTTGCANGGGNEEGADTTDSAVADTRAATDTIVGGEGSDSIVPDAAAASGEAGKTVADTIGTAVDYVQGAITALEPEQTVDAQSYCRDLASTMRDPQAKVAVPSAEKASQVVIDGVNTWNQQTELLAKTLDKCVASTDPAAFLKSDAYGMAIDVFNSCVEGLLKK